MVATAKKIKPVLSLFVLMFLRNKQPNIDHGPLLSTSNGIFSSDSEYTCQNRWLVVLKAEVSKNNQKVTESKETASVRSLPLNVKFKLIINFFERKNVLPLNIYYDRWTEGNFIHWFSSTHTCQKFEKSFQKLQIEFVHSDFRNVFSKLPLLLI